MPRKDFSQTLRKSLISSVAAAAAAFLLGPRADAYGTPDFSWVRRAGGSGGGGTVTGTATDNEGNIFITGVFHGPATFGGTLLNSGSNSLDGFISKLDSRGAWLWTAQMVATNNTSPHIRPSAVAVDALGHVIVTGEAPSTTSCVASFGTNEISLASCEIFVAKYNSTNGDCLWARATGGCDETYDHGVAVDRAGNIYVGGETLRSTNFLVLKLDADGNELLRIKSDSGWLCGHQIRVGNDGDIYVCGALNPPVQLQGIALINAPNREGFIAKFNPGGNLIWVRESGGDTSQSESSWASSLAIDSHTNVLVCGTVYSSNLFGASIASTNPHPQGRPYLLKLAAGGSNLWLKVVDVSGGNFTQSEALDVVADEADNAYMTGFIGGMAQFDAIALDTVRNNNLFVAQCDGTGQFKWAIRDSATNSSQPPYDLVNSIALGSRGLIAAGLAPSSGSFGSITFTNPAGWTMFVAAIDFPPPTLSITRVADHVTLTWPALPSGYFLETAMDLRTTPSATWSTNAASGTISAINGTNYVTLPIDGVQQFFRLRGN